MPSIKVTLPPGTTIALLGTLGETALMPRAWDRSGAMLVLEMAQDPSGLFEMVTHSSTHTSVNLAGDERYVREVIEVRDWLRALGIKGNGPNHHAWVQSVLTNPAIDGLKAAGFLSARAAGAAFPHRTHSDQCIRAGDKTRWLLNSLPTLGKTKNAAAMIAEIDAWRAVSDFVMLNGHDFRPTSSDAYTMAISKHTQLLEYIASLHDAGSMDLMLWSDWFNTYCS